MNWNLPKELEFDWEGVRQNIVNAIKSEMKNSKAVIGISGGLDSSVTASLLVEALGKENVFGLILPERGVTPKDDIEDALNLVKSLKISHMEIEITPAVNVFPMMMPQLIDVDSAGEFSNPVAYANIKARVRMIILYANANLMENALVIGTGNKSELLLGYCTKYGDHGVDLLPIGSLYKSQIRYLAEKLGLFERVWMKDPSPRLLKDQTAESEIGIDYNTIDRVLYYLVEEQYDEDKIVDQIGVSIDVVKKISKMIAQSNHKRKTPPIL